MIDKVAANANYDPEKQAYNSANSVIRFCLGPDSADKSVAGALNNELKEQFEKDAADNSDNSSKSFTSDFPEWHGCFVSGLTPELSRAAAEVWPKQERTDARTLPRRREAASA